MIEISKISLGTYQWVLSTSVVIVLTCTAFYLERILFSRVLHHFKRTCNPWGQSLVLALHRPLMLLIWLLGATFVIQYLSLNLPWIPLSLSGMRSFSWGVFVLWSTVRFLSQLENHLWEGKDHSKKLDRMTLRGVIQLLKISFTVLFLLVGLQSYGIPVSGILAFGGFGGLAVGFAAKDLLANFFGGFMLFLDRPFVIGDWIRSPDHEIEGVVEQIGWRLTRIRTLDRRPLYVPNALFSNIAIENPSRMKHRRIKEYIGVRYEDAGVIAKIVPEIEKFISSHEKVVQTLPVVVRFVRFSPSSLDIMVSLFTTCTDFSAFSSLQQELFLKIISLIEEQGAECAFPTTTLHIPDPISMRTIHAQQ